MGFPMTDRKSARPSDASAHQPHRQARERSRGQSLVEFALVIPILLLLTLTALDFGRVYLGYINLQNMARIASNFAANNPDAWGATPDAAAQTRYKNQILADAAATNCVLPKVAGVTTVPAPVFTDADGDGKSNGLGDKVKVAIDCTFGVITPGIANILGGSVAVSADSNFPVKSGLTSFAGTGGGSGTAPNAAFLGNGVIAPSSISGVAPFVVDFRDSSGGSPTAWAWDFKDGSTSTAQDPGFHTFTNPGTYVVSMAASNFLGSSSQTMGVTVVASTTVDFTADVTTGTAPLAVTFTSTATPGGTAFAWTFGSGQGTGTGATTSKTYSTPGTYTVTLTVTYPAPTGAVVASKTGYISVGVGNCTVPSLNGVKRNSAPGVWTGAGFTGTVSNGPGAPSGNYTITAQSITANSLVPCNSSVVVNRP